MNDDELLRYSRHLLLGDVDVAGQQRLLDAHIVIMGLGGLGSPAALYLAAAGIGTLTLVDPDTVELSNLQRQIAHDTGTIGHAKTASAGARISALNPGTQVHTVTAAPSGAELEQLCASADIVLDGTDRFASRFAINATCWAAGTPLVSGAAIRWEGQVACFDPGNSASPCYQCLHPQTSALQDVEQSCATSGVIAPLVGVIGSMQALEAIKLLTGIGESLVGKVSHFDARYSEWRTFTLAPDPGCPICSATAR
ncbi:MAG: ThiF family adenylyltransferase [Pseudomonadales bacterium]